MFNFFSKKRREKALRGEEEQDLFARKYKAFRELLDANNAVLSTMADMQEKASGAYVFDAAYVESSYRSVAEGIDRIIDSLNYMSDNKYKDLARANDRINKVVEEALYQTVAVPETDYVLALESVHKDKATSCGGKMACLGEAANETGLQVPSAFVITTFAYQSFVQHNRIEALLKQKCDSVDIRDYAALEDASREMQGLVQESEVPGDLQDAVLIAFDEMKRQTGEASLHVSVRSSAILEDIMASFAGQYATVLNVTRDNLIEAYKKVISSQFTPNALFYFKDKGFNINEMAMAAGVVQMIDPASSGIAYSRDPRDPDEDVVLINAVWGLGDYAVGGVVPPETFKVIASAKDGSRILRNKEGVQRVMSCVSANGGTQEMAVPDHLQDTSCLNDDQAQKVNDLTRRLEVHFGVPQDMEWAIDQKGDIFVLQSRPLRLSYGQKEKPPDRPRHIKGHKLLLDQGKIACRGVAAGPVCQVREEKAMADFPKGGVMVIRQAHPEFAPILDKASAVISDTGAVLGHLATVARELNVPAIFNAKDATKALRDGEIVTVDAQYCRVYEGEVSELLKAKGDKQTRWFANSPAYQHLGTILKEITPLYMTDPRAPDFRAKTCRTFHDITRFSHEMALKEMFDFSKHTYFSEKSAKKLVSKEIPLEWLVIDLEDGLKPDLKGKRIGPENIVSEPMRAMWEGMTAVPWKGPPPMDTKGFLSVVAGSATDPDTAAYMTDKNYIVLSKNFCNLSVRLGFHFSTTEAYLGEKENQNYVSFAFKGGGADSGRRNRRVAFIARILDKFDFSIEIREDNIFARIEGHEEAFLKERLKVLGHVIVHTRQMDMVMHNEKMVEWYYKDMIKGIESFVNIPH
jgi:pyruvate,water dikinase